jgi:uncharacterized repeat protein (TIGR01451 family)
MVAFLAAVAQASFAAAPEGQRRMEVFDEHFSVAVPQGWSVAPRFASNTIDLVALPQERLHEYRVPQGDALGVISTWTPRVTVSQETLADHARAVSRLAEIASEVATAPTFTTIAGWPALERTHLGFLPRRGRPVPGQPDAGRALVTTTAIAAGNVVIRYEGLFPPASPPEVLEQAAAIGRGTAVVSPGDPARAEQEVETLRAAPRRDFSLFKATPAPPGAASAAAPRVHTLAAGAALRVMGGTGEIEITASDDGQDVVVARQNATRTSNDGGQTFPFSSGMPFANFGDPSLAVGESGTFYYAGISANTPCGGTPLYGCSTGVARSTNRGQTFTVFSHAVTCPQPPDANACFPDQEHIAADRVNPGGSGDQVYSVWRNFTVGELPTIVCSQDGGVNWTAPLTVENPGDVPRIAVGPDGFVYVVYGQNLNIRVNKFSSCANGLVQQAFFPVTATAYTPVVCPVEGLDRCNDGNVLASPMLAVDENNASRVFLVYASGNGSGEDILLRRSTDGGLTWSAPVTVNGGAAAARRFMPWVSVNGGVVHITWYDRRAALVAGTSDQTDFYRNSVDASTLAVGVETALQINQDPQCDSGWPCGTRAVADAEQCANQPQLAGFCKDGSGVIDPFDQRCDFSDGDCNPGYTCQTDGGCPKYGDYNGNATAGGWAFSGWTSAVAPPGLAENGGLEIYFEAYQTGPDPDITIGKVDTVDPVNAGQAVGYVVTVTNNDDTLAVGITVTDTLTSPFQAVSAPGWSCVTPAVGSPGLLTCSLASLPGGDSAQFTVSVTAPNIIGTITNSATVTGDNDANALNNASPIVSTAVRSPADVHATKSLSSPWGLGNLYPGAPLTYTIVLTNASQWDQFDNAGDEFTDVIPPQLTITGSSATAGTISTVGNTVSWNGVVPGNGAVTLLVDCQINFGTDGLTVSNQGTVHCDADGQGTNESNRPTDDPAVGGASDPTAFQVKVPIPTLGLAGLAAFLALVAVAGLWILRRTSAA